LLAEESKDKQQLNHKTFLYFANQLKNASSCQIEEQWTKVLDNFKEINKELDHYILELTQLEFGLNIDEISKFTEQLTNSSSELERNILLKQEIEKQEIKLPFEMGNAESTQNWLLGLVRN
jgi:hypothetical protein